MNERCSNCGKELFAGQQFCRQCGAPTRQFSSGEIPTQILPGAQTPPPPPTDRQPYAAGTTPLGARNTDDIYQSRFAQQYQPPAAAPVSLPTQTAQFQRKHSRRGWIVGLLCVLVLFLGGSLFVAQIITDRIRHRIIIPKSSARAVPAVPALPPVPAMPGVDESDGADLSPLDEAGAEVSGDKTVITKTFPLAAGASFSLSQKSGDITVEGWDENQAQVTITKEGGDADDRAGVEIMHAATDKGLTLRTPEDTDEVKQIKYAIKLPRTLRQIEIKSLDSDIALSNLAGSVAISTMRGDVSVSKLTGAVATHTMKGDISVDLKGVTPTQPQSFNTVKGDIQLAVGGSNAEVSAETVVGGVSADSGLGISVEKQFAGSRAAGTVGRGGQAVAAKTVNGSVKIKN